MSFLLEMTDVPMKNILEKCDFKSVLTLRKVCHSLRNFIDDSSLQTDLKSIHIDIEATDISVNFQSYETVTAADHWTSNDLKIILNILNSKLSTFRIDTHPENPGALDALEEILKNKPRPLQAEFLEMGISGCGELLKILPHIHSKALNEIYITRSAFDKPGEIISDRMEEIAELEQFKNLKEIIIKEFSVPREFLKKFFNFKLVEIKVHELSLEDLVELKKAFTTSPRMRYFQINGHRMNEDKLETVFGAPFLNNSTSWKKKQWYFKIQKSKKHVLKISILGLLEFWKWPVKKVPKDAVVKD
ncbi:unnamed protein product [Caenorhabditis brenneri]